MTLELDCYNYNTRNLEAKRDDQIRFQPDQLSRCNRKPAGIFYISMFNDEVLTVTEA